MSRAERLIDPHPLVRRDGITTTEKTRASIKRDAVRLLPPYFKKIQAQSGLTSETSKMVIRGLG